MFFATGTRGKVRTDSVIPGHGKTGFSSIHRAMERRTRYDRNTWQKSK